MPHLPSDKTRKPPEINTKLQNSYTVPDNCPFIKVRDMQRTQKFYYGGEERRDAAENRRRILEAAQRLFAERGVEAVSMHEVGQEAGVGQGTLYRRFAHRGELCFALLVERAEEFATRMNEVAGDGSRPALVRLETLLEGLTAFNEHNGELLLAVRGAHCGRHKERHDNPFYRWLRDTVEALLRSAVEEGEIPALDAEVAPDLVLAPLDIDLYLYQRRELGLEQGRIADCLKRMIFDGLGG